MKKGRWSKEVLFLLQFKITKLSRDVTPYLVIIFGVYALASYNQAIYCLFTPILNLEKLKRFTERAQFLNLI